MFHSFKLACLGLIGEGQLDVRYPFKNNPATIPVLSTKWLLFILLLTLALECFLSTNLSWVSLSMGGQFSLKLGVCDRIVYQFFSSLLWQFFLTRALHRPARG